MSRVPAPRPCPGCGAVHTAWAGRCGPCGAELPAHSWELFIPDDVECDVPDEHTIFVVDLETGGVVEYGPVMPPPRAKPRPTPGSASTRRPVSGSEWFRPISRSEWFEASRALLAEREKRARERRQERAAQRRAAGPRKPRRHRRPSRYWPEASRPMTTKTPRTPTLAQYDGDEPLRPAQAGLLALTEAS